MTKYNSRRIFEDGYSFDSIREYQRYTELKLMLHSGYIANLKVHPRYELIPAFEWRGQKVRAIHYEADFEYVENGQTVIEDVKGFATQVFRLKEKLFKYRYKDIDFRRT
jgi:hypothetical protein